jgi:hypothetical protein
MYKKNIRITLVKKHLSRTLWHNFGYKFETLILQTIY